MPKLVNGGVAVWLISSGLVIRDLIRFGRSPTRRSVLTLTARSSVALLAFGVVTVAVWSSRRGKLMMRDRVIEGLDLHGEERVLDVGCGNGLLLIGAGKKLTTGTATGVDVWRSDLESRNSADSVRGNASLAGVTDRVLVESADARALPFADETFDVVLTSLMLHHMSDADRARAVGEMVRTLSTGGRLVIVDVAHVGALRGVVEAAGVASVAEVDLGLPLYKRLVAIK